MLTLADCLVGLAGVLAEWKAPWGVDAAGFCPVCWAFVHEVNLVSVANLLVCEGGVVKGELGHA